jgi:TATA-box binding protein (TBP) (component of TFIID and TFIIIB)
MVYTIIDYMNGQISSIPIQKYTPKDKSPKVDFSKLNYKIDLENKPDDVIISTMTITCKADTEFIVENIGKYIDLNHSSIITVKYGRDVNRTLVPKKITNQKKKKIKKHFYNQVTIKVKTKKDKIINIKLFINGSIQMTGCKSIEGAYEALDKLFRELRIEKGILNHSLNKIEDKPFATNITNLTLEKITDFKIAMINSNFNIGFNIDRDKLYNIMTLEGKDCTFDPLNHAGVITRYEHADKSISIFVFESGSIVITGVRNCQQIKEAYDYINKYLLTKYHSIQKNDNLTNSTILEYIDKHD